jgi:hypothetical protein
MRGVPPNNLILHAAADAFKATLLIYLNKFNINTNLSENGMIIKGKDANKTWRLVSVKTDNQGNCYSPVLRVGTRKNNSIQ